MLQNLIDDFNELLAIEVLQRVKMPTGLARDLVARFSLFRHISSDIFQKSLSTTGHHIGRVTPSLFRQLASCKTSAKSRAMMTLPAQLTRRCKSIG
jgi:hypothetical protein